MMNSGITLHDIFNLNSAKDRKKRNKKLNLAMKIHLQDLLDKGISVVYEKNSEVITKKIVNGKTVIQRAIK